MSDTGGRPGGLDPGDEPPAAVGCAERVLECVSDGIVALDRDWRYTYVNTRGAELLGQRREDLLGKVIWTRFPEGSGPSFRRAYEKAMTERVQVQLREYYEPWDRWFENRIYPTPDGIAILFTDVTEQVRARRRLDFLLQATPAVIYTAPPSGDFGASFVSENVRDVTGYDTEPFLKEPGFWLSRVHPDDAVRVLAGRERLIESGELRTEYRFRLADGTYRWMEDAATVMRNPDGTPIEIAGYFLDVTVRRDAEAALRLSEAQYRLLFLADPHPMWVLDIETLGFLAANDAAMARYGYSRDEFLAMSVADVLPAAEVPRYLEYIRGPTAASSEPRIWRHRAKDGELFDVEVTAHNLEFDGRAARLVRAHDVTARLNAESALRLSEERFRAIAANTPDHIIIQDRELRYEMVLNPQLGLTEADLLGRTDQEILGGEDGAKLTALKRGVLETGAPVHTEVSLTNRDGDTEFFEGVYVPMFDEKGAADGVIGYFRNVTERKEREGALRRSRERLRALTARIERLREEERTRISREIHDELGQALTGIQMDLRWVERWIADRFGDDAGVNPVLDRVVEAGAAADAVLTAVQRIAAELRPGILDRLGLGAAIQSEASRFEERSGIACRVDVPESEPRLERATTTALFRIFQEALTNVARHSRASAVDVVYRAGPEGLSLEVRDDGRGSAALDVAVSGSLGLLGMRERVRLVGGEVSFRSDPEGGLIVAVRVPAAGPGEGTP